MSKIIQIAAGGGQSEELFALDDEGHIFVYDNHGPGGDWAWTEIDSPRPMLSRKLLEAKKEKQK